MRISRYGAEDMAPGGSEGSGPEDCAPSQDRCSASELLRRLGLQQETNAATDALGFPLRSMRAGRSLMLEGGLFKSLYFVLQGSFKCIRTCGDGSEQVQGFAMPGDMLGLDGLGEGRYASGAVALEAAQVVVLPFRELLRLGHELPVLEQMLHRCAGRELARRNRSVEVMAAGSAEARLARFLLLMAHQQGHPESGACTVRLPMSRRDMAGHLGLAPESVNRALAALEGWGYLELHDGEAALFDADALEHLPQRVELSHEAQDVRERMPQRSRRGWAAGALRTPVQ